MIQICRGYAPVDNNSTFLHLFSIIADDNGFSYTFGSYPGSQMFDSASRVALVMSTVPKQTAAFTSNDYIVFAQRGLDYYWFEVPFEVDNAQMAARTEELDIDQDSNNYSQSVTGARLAWQALNTADAFQDFPDLEDQLSSNDQNQQITSDGMTNLVMTALGNIDPNGPNGWLLDHFANDTDSDSSDSESSDPSGIIVDNASQYDAAGMPITGDN